MRITAEKVLGVLKAHRTEFKKFGVTHIGLFGSYLKGKQKRGSDIDFIVSFKQPSFDNYMELKFLLERLFGKKVDLVTESSLKPAFSHIKKEAKYVRAA